MPWRADTQLADAVQHTTGFSVPSAIASGLLWVIAVPLVQRFIQWRARKRISQ